MGRVLAVAKGDRRYYFYLLMLLALIASTPKFEYIAQTRAGHKITNYDRLWKSFKRQLNIHMGCKLYRNQLLPPYPVAPDLVPYCFRHEFCTELARKGVDIREAQILMGHADISTTINIYTYLDKKDVALNLAKGTTKKEAAN